MKKLIATLGLVVFITGCNANTVAEVSPLQKEYEMKLAATQAAVDKAASVGGEWRDIRWKKSKIQYLPSAIKAAEAGDYEKAIELLDMAKFQAEMGYQQAMEQKNAGPRF